MGCGVTKLDHEHALIPSKYLRKLSNNTRCIIKELEGVPQYTFKKVLGQGRFGRILLLESAEPKHQVAVKAILKGNFPLHRVVEEVSILSKVDHPNIVKYIKAFQSKKYVYIVMEYCPGENLFQKILAQDKFSEAKTATIMEELLRAINHCHHLGIIHRDLKPENIMYSEESVLKIIDFGLSMQEKSFSLEELAGTKYYIAPEIIRSSTFTKACDIWSLGIIMHLLLTGYLPVGGNSSEEFYSKLLAYEGPNFANEIWNIVSKEAKDLLYKMLDTNHLTRISAADALNHPWFKSEKKTEGRCNVEVLRALWQYSESSKLKKELLSLIVKSIDDSDLKHFQQDFLDMDKQKTGLITYKELQEYLKRIGYEVEAEKLEEFTKKINQKGESCINYSEFMAAVISTRQFLTDEKLENIFKVLDLRQKGGISRNGVTIEKGGVKEIDPLTIITKPDKAEDNMITLSEFKAILLN